MLSWTGCSNWSVNYSLPIAEAALAVFQTGLRVGFTYMAIHSLEKLKLRISQYVFLKPKYHVSQNNLFVPFPYTQKI